MDRAEFESPWRGRDGLIVAVLTLVALVLRLYHLDYRGMWTDEFHTLRPVLLPMGEMVRERLAAGHLPTYFALVKAWVMATGSTSDWNLRFPSAVAGAFIVSAAWALCRPNCSRGVAVAVALMACFNGMSVWAGQEARMYGFLMVAATFSHAALLRAFDRGGAAAWMQYVAWLFVAIAFQPVMLVFWTGHLAFAWTQRRVHPRQFRAFFAGVVALLLLLVPAAVIYVLMQRKYTGLDFHSSDPWLMIKRLALVAFASDGAVRFMRYGALAVLLLCSAALAAGLRGRWGSLPAADRRILLFCGLAVGVPSLLLWIAGFFFYHVVGIERYLLPAAAPLWLLVAWSIAHTRNQMTRQALGAAVVIITIAGLAGQLLDRGSGIREAVQYLSAHAAPGEPILFDKSATVEAALRHYSKIDLLACPWQEASSVDERLEVCAPASPRVWLLTYRKDKSGVRAALDASKRYVEDPATAYEFKRARIQAYRNNGDGLTIAPRF